MWHHVNHQTWKTKKVKLRGWTKNVVSEYLWLFRSCEARLRRLTGLRTPDALGLLWLDRFSFHVWAICRGHSCLLVNLLCVNLLSHIPWFHSEALRNRHKRVKGYTSGGCLERNFPFLPPFQELSHPSSTKCLHWESGHLELQLPEFWDLLTLLFPGLNTRVTSLSFCHTCLLS